MKSMELIVYIFGGIACISSLLIGNIQAFLGWGVASMYAYFYNNLYYETQKTPIVNGGKDGDK